MTDRTRPSYRCPTCKSEGKFTVQLPAAFTWDGGGDIDLTPRELAACQFPIENDSWVICTSCEWTGKVSDMLSCAGRKVTLSFTVTTDYQIDVVLAVPPDCDHIGVKQMIDAGDIDWLEEINQQHSSCSIERHGKIEHRELLSVDIVEEASDE
jgi:RecJ-like exonuclease